MDPKTPKATALERAKQFGARAVQEVVKPTGKVLLGMAQELGKAPIKAAMAPTDILSIAATGKPLPPLKVPGLGEVSSYGRRAVELQKEPGYTPAIAALQAGSEGVLDIASAGQIGALARAARTARDAVAATKVSPAKTNVLQERLGNARDAITRSMTRSIREPSMGLSIKRVGTSADNLTSEARKYKSAEEFVKAQEDKILYHGDAYAGYSDTPYLDVRPGLSLTNDLGFAESYAARSSPRGIIEDGAKVRNFIISDKAKVLDKTNIGRIDGEKMRKVIQDAKDNGYDVVRFQTTGVSGIGGSEEFHVLNPKIIKEIPDDKIKTKSQLTDIWNKANKRGKYLYHGTSETILDSIAKDGLKPMGRGVTSLSKDENYARSFAESSKFPRKEGQGVMLRIKADAVETTPSISGVPSDKLNELLTKQIISPKDIEILKDDKWQSLTDIWNKAQGGSRGKTNALKKKIDTE